MSINNSAASLPFSNFKENFTMTMMQTEKSINVFESRWGYHPCDYETFLKLKALHKAYWQAVYDYAKRIRWERKTVNQQGVEPKINLHFVKRIGFWGNVHSHVTDHGIREAYQLARMPISNSSKVKPILSKEQIEDLYNKIIG